MATMASHFLQAYVGKTEFYSLQLTRIKSRNSYTLVLSRWQIEVSPCSVLSQSIIHICSSNYSVIHYCFPCQLYELKNGIITELRSISRVVLIVVNLFF